jgi:hypothetical protein
MKWSGLQSELIEYWQNNLSLKILNRIEKGTSVPILGGIFKIVLRLMKEVGILSKHGNDTDRK